MSQLADVCVSVVIPARNSAGTIADTLKALGSGERQADEIIVVDGCSSDATAEVARDFGARVVRNEKRHVAAARQLGTEHARHDVIAFTDSDCQPAADWLARLADRFRSDPSLCGVGGKVVPSPPRNFIQEYSARVFEQIMDFPRAPTLVKTRGMKGSFAGANCAFRRESILAAGGFRDAFSNHAEEVDLIWRLIGREAKLLFDPSIVVEHSGYADTIGRLVKVNFNYGIASTKLAVHHIGWQADWKLYSLMSRSALAAASPFSSDRWAALRALQLLSFISGKLYSSVKFKTINL